MADKDGGKRTLSAQISQWEQPKLFSRHFQDSKYVGEKNTFFGGWRNDFSTKLSMQCTIDVTYACWRRQILAKIRNSPNSPHIIAHQNLLIYSIAKCNDHYHISCLAECIHMKCIVIILRKVTDDQVVRTGVSRYRYKIFYCPFVHTIIHVYKTKYTTAT